MAARPRFDRTRAAPWPPASSISQPEIAGAVAEYKQAKAAVSEAYAQREQIARTERVAKAADDRALADHIQSRRAPSKGPGTPATDAWRARLDEAGRLYDARRVHEERAFSLAEAVIEEHSAEWAQMTEAALEQRRLEFVAALDALAQARYALHSAGVLADFSSGRARGWRKVGRIDSGKADPVSQLRSEAAPREPALVA